MLYIALAPIKGTRLIKIKMKAADLFRALNLDNPVNKNDAGIYVDTPDAGLQPIINFFNMGNKPIHKLEIEGGEVHTVADSHIYLDRNGDRVLAREAKEIMTRDGLKKVLTNTFDRVDKTYDIEIPEPNWYYGSNGVIQHNCVLAPINGGKSVHLIQQAADHLVAGKNVLYITLEMDEDTCRERIDVNVLDASFDSVFALEKSQYVNRINDLKKKTCGKLIVKEYPAGSAHVGHFRHLLQELRIKKNFVPDVICIDYLTICASSKLPASVKGNTNTYFTSVAEELRAFAQEQGIPIWTAVQFDRATQGASDAGMGNIGLALGIAATADFMFAILIPDEMAARGMVIGKIIKNRYSSYKGKFMLGLNPDKQKFYEVDQAGGMSEDELKELGLNNIVQEGTQVSRKASAEAAKSWDFN
jgi:hypothetical protein